jgi:plastocyanin
VRSHAAAPPKFVSMRRLSCSVLALGLVALAGCGSSSSTSSSATSSTASETTTSAPEATSTSSSAAAAPANSSGAGSKLSLAADPGGQLKYNTTSLSAKAGKVSIAFANESPEGHNVTIASSSGAVVGATPTFQGSSKTLTLNLKPGTYKFYCSVPGHRMAGMEGTLTVK